MHRFGLSACLIAVLNGGVATSPTRQLSYERIAGYDPGSDVSQHNLIDLDQAEMETHLKVNDFAKAKAIYTLGGNSGAKASITVGALAAQAAKGAAVMQGGVAKGKMKSAAAAGSTSITVSYTSVCKEGGLSTKDVSGCFTTTGGAISIAGTNVGAPTAVTNAYRTLAGFSTAAESKMTGQEFYDPYKAYFTQGDYAHQRVMAALEKTGICSACDNIARVEIAKKTSAYMNVWMYVIREFEDAIQDCQAGCIDCNDDPVHAWDEGVAFYTGSLEGADGGGSGKLIHALADKRCKNFGTCTASGGSAVNAALFPLFEQGKVALQQGKCSDVPALKKRIVELMSVPLVQGALRYAYKVAKKMFADTGSKEKAEGAAFSAAILPRIHVCDASAAKTIADNMNIDAAAPMAAGLAAVKSAFEKTYACLGITCADVGGIIISGTEYYEGAEPCGYQLIAGYAPGSDVSQHNLIDLDQAEMETHLKVNDFAKAKAIYTLGGNSGAKASITVGALAAQAAKGAAVMQGGVAKGKMKSAAAAGSTSITVSYTSVCKEGGLSTKDVSGCFTTTGGAISIAGTNVGAPTAVTNAYRTLAGFSTAAESKMTGQEFYDPYKAYFTQGDYAHQRVMAALEKRGICSACDNIARVEIAKKTSAYMNVWMYVIREFEDAIQDCQAGCIDCNDDPVHAWDEGVAFYTGSLEGTHGGGSGKLIHALADKRCKNFGTCTASGGSAVNAALFPLFEQGKVALQQGKCSDVPALKKRIVELMSVPLVQGALRYAYKVAKKMFADTGSKEKAEGAAFSAAILPRIHVCDASAAKTIADNMNIDAAAPMAAGLAAVKSAFEKTYACLGITCADVGGIIISGTEYYEGAEPCGYQLIAAPAPAPGSYGLITFYKPGSDVTSHSLIDLDQRDMEAQLKTFNFAAAKAIYTLGGNSGPMALITINALTANAAKGAEVKQGEVSFGMMKSTASAGATSITVSYKSVCKEGGLATKDVSGCFTVGAGSISVGGVIVGAPIAVKNAYRTLAGFSTAAEVKMTGQEFYDVYKAYYTQGHYAHQRVLAAFDKTGICSACDDIARVEIAKKTSAYMNVWMYVIREFEDAIDDCKAGCINCNDDPVHAWDEGVAFYSGSLEGVDGSGSGKLLHALADKRCANFGTCSAANGGSAVNAALMHQFGLGQTKLVQGKCSEVPPIKRRIVELMSIPLVQGSLRYAYKVDKMAGGSKEKAEGAAFSAAILPRIHVCDASAAKTISDNMNLDSSSPMADGFVAVKKAFESAYACLGISCKDVGGLLITGTEYYDSAEPCGSAVASAPAQNSNTADDNGDSVQTEQTASKSIYGQSGGAALLLEILIVIHIASL